MSKMHIVTQSYQESPFLVYEKKECANTDCKINYYKGIGGKRVIDDESAEFVESANLKCCSICKKVYYCSEECQREHWPEHKVSCVQITPEEDQLRTARLIVEGFGEKAKNNLRQWKFLDGLKRPKQGPGFYFLQIQAERVEEWAANPEAFSWSWSPRFYVFDMTNSGCKKYVDKCTAFDPTIAPLLCMNKIRNRSIIVVLIVTEDPSIAKVMSFPVGHY